MRTIFCSNEHLVNDVKGTLGDLQVRNAVDAKLGSTKK